jgi:hypothetical protein
VPGNIGTIAMAQLALLALFISSVFGFSEYPRMRLLCIAEFLAG